MARFRNPTRVVATDIVGANEPRFSGDGEWLYVAETGGDHRLRGCPALPPADGCRLLAVPGSPGCRETFGGIAQGQLDNSLPASLAPPRGW